MLQPTNSQESAPNGGSPVQRELMSSLWRQRRLTEMCHGATAMQIATAIQNQHVKIEHNPVRDGIYLSREEDVEMYMYELFGKYVDHVSPETICVVYLNLLDEVQGWCEFEFLPFDAEECVNVQLVMRAALLCGADKIWMGIMCKDKAQDKKKYVDPEKPYIEFFKLMTEACKALLFNHFELLITFDRQETLNMRQYLDNGKL